MVKLDISIMDILSLSELGRIDKDKLRKYLDAATKDDIIEYIVKYVAQDKVEEIKDEDDDEDKDEDEDYNEIEPED